MDTETPTQQTTPEVNIQKLTIKLQKTQLISIDINQQDSLGEIVPILGQHPYLLLHPNFILKHKNTDVQIYQDLASQFPQNSSTDIDVEFQGFDSFTSKQHVINCAKFFLSPNNWLFEKFLEFNVIIGKVDYLTNVIYNQKLSTDSRQVEKLVQGDMELFKGIDFLTKESESQTKSTGFFKKLKYSEYNPPMGEAQLQGDLLYLDLTTLEGTTHCLTLNKNGCFLNTSTEDVFSRKPDSNTFFSLFELMSKLSASFKKDILKFFDPRDPNVILRHSDNYEVMNTEQQKDQFFFTNKQMTKQEKLLCSLVSILEPDTYGFSSTLYRDWNEEFQNLNQMPCDSVLAQVQRVKLLQKSQESFTTAARKLALAITDSNIQPLNPSDNKAENCYVYNNLFATYALDTMKWELPKNDTSPSTYSTVNNDIKNLEQLFNKNIEGVNTINSCAIDFLGQRLVVQTVIQGILHFDQKTWNLYGSIDDGKTMCFDENFHKIVEKICNGFGISKDRSYKDAEGNVMKFNGSPEVKGIKAGDGRKYIMDLMRMSPRDANFPDANEHECCTLRSELVRNYLFFVNLQKQYKDHQKKLLEQQKLKKEEEKKKLEAEGKVVKEVEGENKTEEVKEEKKVEETKKTEEVPETKNNEEVPETKKTEEVPKTKTEKVEQRPFPSSFNTSLFTTFESVDDTVEEEKKDLQVLSNYLKNDVITAFVKRMNTDPLKNPVDQASLIKTLHESGINLRYLGYIYSLAVATQNMFLQQLLQRTIFVRAVRKYLRKIAFSENQETFLNVVVQNLNMMLGNDFIREKLDQKIGNYSNLKQNDSKNTNKRGGKKSKKNKKNKRKVKQTTTSNVNEFMLVKVEQFLEEIKTIAQVRYSYPSDQIKTYSDLTFLNSDKGKLSFLREMTKALGISIAHKNYNFSATESDIEYPLKLKNISNYYPIMKCVKFNLDCLKYNQQTFESMMQRKKYNEALRVLKSSENMVLNSYGLYHEEFIAVCKNVALVKFLQKKHEEAVSVQLFAVKLNQKIYGLDHRNTAISILELSNYLFDKKDFKASVQYHSLALYIFDLIASEYNPNSLLCLHELQIMTFGQKNYKLSTLFMEELLKRNATLHGETSERLIYFLEKLAQLKSLQKNFEEASLLQARHYLILSRSYKKIKSKLAPQQIVNIDNRLQESANLKKYFVEQRNKIRESVKAQ